VASVVDKDTGIDDGIGIFGGIVTRGKEGGGGKDDCGCGY
jgi:hypothetical protein